MQANAISTMGQNVFGVDPVVIGGIVTILASMGIVGGVRNIAKICEYLQGYLSDHCLSGSCGESGSCMESCRYFQRTHGHP